MEIYDNDVDVLANQPGFNWHRENLRNYMNLSSNMPAYLNTHYPKKSKEDENVARLFHTLAGVAMIDGAAQMVDGACEKTYTLVDFLQLQINIITIHMMILLSEA